LPDNISKKQGVVIVWRDFARRMVEVVRMNGVRDGEVLRVLGEVPRHLFIPSLRGPCEAGDQGALRTAYGDHPLPIGFGQTISQPTMVGRMTELLSPEPPVRVLEVGSGCGYQCAVLARMGCSVVGVERIRNLADWSREVLGGLGMGVSIIHGDGRALGGDLGPFDGIVVSAGCSREDVEGIFGAFGGDGCRMVAPVNVGGGLQRVLVLEMEGGEVRESWQDLCRFVPLLGGVEG
jgi:protein-L-isoaspartate(D-aspartate) O-methyltransferase